MPQIETQCNVGENTIVDECKTRGKQLKKSSCSQVQRIPILKCGGLGEKSARAIPLNSLSAACFFFHLLILILII